MYYVYLIQSSKFPDQLYVGYTESIDQRLATHNAGQSPHTAKYRPWNLIVSHVFPDKNKALAFELYLKSGSGRAFSKRHFLG